MGSMMGKQEYKKQGEGEHTWMADANVICAFMAL